MKLNPVVRATGIIGATAALVTGVTFAALSSSATLTNNTIATGTAGLQVSSDGGTTFSNLEDGFAFTGIVPGLTASGDKNFQLKNTGSTDLTVSAKLDGAPAWTTDPVLASVDNTKVNVEFACTDTSATPYGVTTTVAALVLGNVALTGDTLAVGDTATCTVEVSMDAAAFSGSSATSDQFDIVFTGEAL
jgi:predicted ribosomally synthesized peptide with SipW-like signal peptide